MTTNAALTLLTQAGYVIDPTATTAPVPTPPATTEPPPPTETTRGRVTKDGVALTMVIGAAANDPTAVAVANTAADQLRNVGIAASVSALDPVLLFGDAIPNNQVDAVVGWHRAGGDLASEMASRYGCAGLPAAAPPPPSTQTCGWRRDSTSGPHQPDRR